MIKIKVKGNFDKVDSYFKKSRKISKFNNIQIIADNCLEALKRATPKDTGLTAKSWNYEIIEEGNEKKIAFNNTNIQNGVNIALLLEYGHGTPSGTWVEGKEFIAPTIQKALLDAIDQACKEMRRL